MVIDIIILSHTNKKFTRRHCKCQFKHDRVLFFRWYCKIENCCSPSGPISESSESGALSLSSAARHIDFQYWFWHIDFHSLRRIYVAFSACHSAFATLPPSLWRQCPHCRIRDDILFSSLRLNNRDAKCRKAAPWVDSNSFQRVPSQARYHWAAPRGILISNIDSGILISICCVVFMSPFAHAIALSLQYHWYGTKFPQ